MNIQLPIYLDHHATTPLHPTVFEAMRPFFMEDFGNAASRQHVFGWRAEAAVERARAQVAQAMGAEAKEIIFTSGATEGNNMVLWGVAESYRERGRHFITGATEHRAILDPLKNLASRGFEVTVLPVDRYGRVDPDRVRAAIRSDTVLISLMAANNEVGTLHPIAEISKIAQERGVLFHSDAVQAMGKIPFDVRVLGLDLATFSAHKCYGPKGIGVLYIRGMGPRLRLTPLMFGGGHERGLRSGTLNVPGIVGMGAALEITVREMPEESPRLQVLRDRLERGLEAGLEGVTLNGHPTERLPHNLNLSFAGVLSEALMMEMKEIAVSAGSACTSAQPEPSHVLRAIGLPAELAKGSLRFGLGRANREAEIDYVIQKTVAAVRRLREQSPERQMQQAGERRH